MKKIICLQLLLLVLCVPIFAQTNEFTYQGKLTDSGTPAATYDFEFRLCASDTGDCSTAPVLLETKQRLGVAVLNGIFTVKLDFAAAHFTGADRFLEIMVRRTSGDPWTPLTPRQKITSAPFSIRAANAFSADLLSAVCNPCVIDSQIAGVSGSKLEGGSITADKFAANSVTEIAIRDDNVTTTKISDTAVTNAKLADGSVSTSKIVDSSVTTPKIADGSVTKAKLAPDYKNGFDPQNVALMRWDQIPQIPRIADVGRNPSALAFDGTFMYVANKMDNNVMRIRTSTGLIEGSPIPVGTAPVALVYDGFRSIWVANSGSGTLSRISILNAAVDMSVNVTGMPCSLGFDGTLIYVGDCNSNQVTRVTKPGAVVGAVTVGHKTVSLAFDGTYMYVSEPQNQSSGEVGNVRRIHASTGAVSLIPGPNGALGVNVGALAFDGTFIYAASGNTVFRIRSTTGTFETNSIEIAEPLSASNKALVFDGTFVYASGAENDLSTIQNGVIRLNRNGLRSERNSIPTQGEITALSFDGTYIYAASHRYFNNPKGGTTVVNGDVTRF
jgi:hypothetical protein